MSLPRPANPQRVRAEDGDERGMVDIDTIRRIYDEILFIATNAVPGDVQSDDIKDAHRQPVHKRTWIGCNDNAYDAYDDETNKQCIVLAYVERLVYGMCTSNFDVTSVISGRYEQIELGVRVLYFVLLTMYTERTLYVGPSGRKFSYCAELSLQRGVRSRTTNVSSSLDDGVSIAYIGALLHSVLFQSTVKSISQFLQHRYVSYSSAALPHIHRSTRKPSWRDAATITTNVVSFVRYHGQNKRPSNRGGVAVDGKDVRHIRESYSLISAFTEWAQTDNSILYLHWIGKCLPVEQLADAEMVYYERYVYTLVDEYERECRYALAHMTIASSGLHKQNADLAQHMDKLSKYMDCMGQCTLDYENIEFPRPFLPSPWSSHTEDTRTPDDLFFMCEFWVPTGVPPIDTPDGKTTAASVASLFESHADTPQRRQQ
jgi:hypothetical protein